MRKWTVMWLIVGLLACISTGESLSQDFEEYSSGTSAEDIPGWETANDTLLQYCTVASVNSAFDGGSRSLRYKDDDTSGVGSLSVSRTFPSVIGNMVFSFDVKLALLGKNPVVLIRSDTTDGVKLALDNYGAGNNVQYQNENGTWVTVSSPLSAGSWYRFQITVSDVTTGDDTFDIRILDSSMNVVADLSDCGFRNDVDQLDCICFSVNTGTGVSGADYYIDNLQMVSPVTRYVGPGMDFTSISSALDAANPGDHIVVHSGIYREELAVQDDNVLLTAAPGAEVIVSGCDLVSQWSLDSGSVYKASFVNGTGITHPQVFVDGQLMLPAAYPNLSSDMHYDWWGDDTYAHNVSGGEGVVDFNTGKASDYWEGGTYLGLNGAAWVSIEGRISSSTSTNLVCTDLTASYWSLEDNTKMVGSGQGMILHHRNALDTAGECHWEDNELYLWAPGSANPSTKAVEAQVRKWGLSMDGCRGVIVDGLHFRATAVSLSGATNCTVRNCSVLYGTPCIDRFGKTENLFDPSIDLKNSSGNHIEACYVAHSWGAGIRVDGEDALVENCVIEDLDWYGGWGSAIWFQAGSSNCTAMANTIRKTGRCAFSGNPSDSYILNNRMSDTMVLSRDGGAMYLKRFLGEYDQFAADVSYNWIEHCYDFINRRQFVTGNNIATGIYTDNGSDGFKVHHNLIWRADGGIQMNCHPPVTNSVDDAAVYNNTIWDTPKPMLSWSTGCYLDIKTYNNLAQTNIWLGNDIRCCLTASASDLFIDATPNDLYDFRIKDGSTAINYGTVANGIPRESEYAGAYPEAGAYEAYNVALGEWIAGAESRSLAEDSFESGGLAGGSGWIGSGWGSGGLVSINGAGCRSGEYGMQISGSSGNDYAFREVLLSTAPVGTLTFWWKASGFSSAAENMRVQIIDVAGASYTVTGVAEFGQDQADGYWHFASIDLSGYEFSGQRQQIKFAGVNMNSGSSFCIDDLSIDAHAPVFEMNEMFEGAFCTNGMSVGDIPGWDETGGNATQYAYATDVTNSPFSGGEPGKVLYYADEGTGAYDLHFYKEGLALPSSNMVYMTFDYYCLSQGQNPTFFFKDGSDTKGIHLCFDSGDGGHTVQVHDGVQLADISDYSIKPNTWYRFELLVDPVDGADDRFSLMLTEYGEGVVINACNLPFRSNVNQLDEVNFGTNNGLAGEGSESFYDNIRIYCIPAEVDLMETFETASVGDHADDFGWSCVNENSNQYAVASDAMSSAFGGGSQSFFAVDQDDFSGLYDVRFSADGLSLRSDWKTKISFDYYRDSFGQSPTFMMKDDSGVIGPQLRFDSSVGSSIQVYDGTQWISVSDYTLKSDTWYHFELVTDPVAGLGDRFDLTVREYGEGVVVETWNLPFRNDIDQMDQLSLGTNEGADRMGHSGYYDNIKIITFMP